MGLGILGLCGLLDFGRDRPFGFLGDGIWSDIVWSRHDRSHAVPVDIIMVLDYFRFAPAIVLVLGATRGHLE